MASDRIARIVATFSAILRDSGVQSSLPERTIWKLKNYPEAHKCPDPLNSSLGGRPGDGYLSSLLGDSNMGLT